jgi:hypothetical protein
MVQKSDESRRWLEAGKALATDPAAVVKCPVCQEGNLTVRDVPIAGTLKFERIMRCQNCGAFNVLLMNKKQ